jgi:hypothetical protein
MAHKVRVDLPPDVSETVVKAVWGALHDCPEDDNWQVAIVQDPLAPENWEAAAAGPQVDTGGAWEELAAGGRWSRSPEALYRRTFEGPQEQDPAFIRECLHALFRCFERTGS